MRALTLPRPVKISIAGVLPGVPDADCSGAELAWGAPVELSRLEPAVAVASPGVPGDGSTVRPHVVCSHATCSGVKELAIVEARSSTTARLSSRWSCNDCLYNCIYCIPLLLIETSSWNKLRLNYKISLLLLIIRMPSVPMCSDNCLLYILL